MHSQYSQNTNSQYSHKSSVLPKRSGTLSIIIILKKENKMNPSKFYCPNKPSERSHLGRASGVTRIRIPV